ncbi:MAG: glycosyltransferase family 2 protein [Xanthomonadales bacterium]|nr:glycosyltransferase family 2 protein [Xanthomonadales bacterium]
MKLVMTLLVRDEQDIIRENIEYHMAQGVDFFIATDNRSIDATANILMEYESRGLLHYIHEASDNYNQHAWVTRMARLACAEYGANWIINNDADEFWWPVQGSLGETFARLPDDVNIVKAQRHNFVPVESQNKPFWSRMLYREKTSLNPLGRPLPPKVAHRGSATVKVSQGNHSVSGITDPHAVDGLIEIFHYPIRNYRQIENKIALGGAAYKRNQELAESVGITWRKLYDDLQRDDNLNSYFTEQLRTDQRLKKELDEGSLVIDKRLSEYFAGNLDL